MTAPPAVDLSPLWAHLDDLPSCEIPSDLTEIDGPWVYYVLYEVDCEQIEEALLHTSRKDMEGLAYDLRDKWHTAICERAEWDANRPHDYE